MAFLSLARSFGKKPISFAVSFSIATLSAAVVVESLRNNAPPAVSVKARNVSLETSVRPKNGSCIVLIQVPAEDFASADIDVDGFLDELGKVLFKIVIRDTDIDPSTTFKAVLLPLFDAVEQIESAVRESIPLLPLRKGGRDVYGSEDDDKEIRDSRPSKDDKDMQSARRSRLLVDDRPSMSGIEAVAVANLYHPDVRGIAIPIVFVMDRVDIWTIRCEMGALLAALPSITSEKPSAAEVDSLRLRFASIRGKA